MLFFIKVYYKFHIFIKIPHKFNKDNVQNPAHCALTGNEVNQMFWSKSLLGNGQLEVSYGDDKEKKRKIGRRWVSDDPAQRRSGMKSGSPFKG